MNKIDIRDLRIDNWIYHKDCSIPLQISGLKDDEVYLKHSFTHNRTVGFVRQDRPSVCSIDEINPIPLTKEILEKNGFKYEEFPEFAVNEITETTEITITYHSGSDTIFIGISEPNFNLTSSLVLYVHEMQNLLRDARIEKEITI